MRLLDSQQFRREAGRAIWAALVFFILIASVLLADALFHFIPWGGA